MPIQKSRGMKEGIRRRKQPVATLAPLAAPVAGGSWTDHRRRLQKLWGCTVIGALDETLSELRSED